MTFTVTAVLALGGLIGYAFTRPTPWRRSGPPVTVSGWAPYWQTDAALASFAAHAVLFSDLSLFAYQATAADVVAPFDGLDAGAPDAYRSAVHAAGVAFTASIVDGTPAHAMAGILANPKSRTVHVQTIVALAKGGGFDGIDLDYENFAFNDGRDTWDATRPNWGAFVTELAGALHHIGKTLSVSVPPSGDYSVYDYETIGKVVDKIRIMAYDFSTSEAGPIAPLGWVTDVVKSAKKLVPAAKLVLGVPVYGYNWPSHIDGRCPGTDDEQPKRTNVSTASAVALASSVGVVPTWDPRSAERTFTYTDVLTGGNAAGIATSCTVIHTVWYEDAQAVHDRAYLAEREDLAGVSIWSLGSDDPLVWDAIAAARANVEVWPPVTASGSTVVSAAATSTVLTAG